MCMKRKGQQSDFLFIAESYEALNYIASMVCWVFNTSTENKIVALIIFPSHLWEMFLLWMKRAIDSFRTCFILQVD